jgi:hypothetical protein
MTRFRPLLFGLINRWRPRSRQTVERRPRPVEFPVRKTAPGRLCSWQIQHRRRWSAPLRGAEGTRQVNETFSRASSSAGAVPAIDRKQCYAISHLLVAGLEAITDSWESQFDRPRNIRSGDQSCCSGILAAACAVRTSIRFAASSEPSKMRLLLQRLCKGQTSDPPNSFECGGPPRLSTVLSIAGECYCQVDVHSPYREY